MNITAVRAAFDALRDALAPLPPATQPIEQPPAGGGAQTPPAPENPPSGPPAQPDDAPVLAVGWSFLEHAPGPPWAHPTYGGGGKHATMLCEWPYVYRFCGDYEGGGNVTTPDGAHTWNTGSTRREVYRADLRVQPLAWELVQPMFMPAGQDQGPQLGPDQHWLWRDKRGDIWVGPGEYRAGPSGYDGADFGVWRGERRVYKWLRPGWWHDPRCREKDVSGETPESATVFPSSGYDRPGKFGAYHAGTDRLYSIITDDVIDVYDHAAGDFRRLRPTAWSKDDQGRDVAHVPGASIEYAGSYHVCIGDAIYSIGHWRLGADKRAYLIRYDVVTKVMSYVTCPFILDPDWTLDGSLVNQGNPSEHTFIVELEGRIYIAANTHYGEPTAGQRPFWCFDPATGAFTQLPAPPAAAYGNAMVAIPELRAFAMLGPGVAKSAGGQWRIALYTVGEVAQQAPAPEPPAPAPEPPAPAPEPPAPAPEPPAPAGKLVYSLASVRPHDQYNAFHSTVIDSKGRAIHSGVASHGGTPGIYAYDPILDQTVTLRGNTGDYSVTDNFPVFYVPEFDIAFQHVTWAYNIGQDRIIPWGEFCTYVGSRAQGWPGWAYNPSHDWDALLDAGVSLGGVFGSNAGGVWTKVPGGKIALKVLGLPPRAQVGYVIGAARCWQGWLYVFSGSQRLFDEQRNEYLPGVINNRAFRVSVQAMLAAPPDSTLPDSAIEELPDMPNGGGNVSVNTDTGRLYIWHHRVTEYDPAARTYRDVTPDGWPALENMQVGYSPAAKAHIVYGGNVPGVGIYDGSIAPWSVPGNPRWDGRVAIVR